MHRCYSKLTTTKNLLYKTALFSSVLLVSTSLSAQVKDSTVTAIYTSFGGYWATNTTSPSTTFPDSSHNLLAFKFRGNTYSTGVNDALLNTKLGSSNFKAQVFKSLPVNNIAGNVVAGGATYIALAAKNDGNASGFGYSNPFPVIHIKDVLTDGANGLDLGTGVTNLPAGAHMSFSIQNLSPKSVTDSIPDLVFTQIADPTGAGADTIYFYDASNNLVGNKKLVNWSNVSKLGTYKLDLYSLTTGVSCNTSTISGTVASTPTRDIRMVAFLLTEFGITSANAASVKGIQINPNGTSDQAFIAYNTNLITIDAPTIVTQPQTQIFCSNSTTSVTFNVTSGSSNDTYQWKKNGTYIPGATGSSYTANSLTLADTANAYSVTVTNTVGSVTSSNAYVKYVIVAQPTPTSLYVATGSPASFTITTSGATAFQWQKNAVTVSGQTTAIFSKSSVALTDAGSYTAIVTSSGPTCTSNAVTLTVEDLPVITAQPQAQVLCNSSVTSDTFSVAATSISALSYQWYKNGTAVSGATANIYIPTGLTLADTANSYYVKLTNGVGSTTSNSVNFKYLIVAQPSPASAYLATGNTVTFSAAASTIATAYQWKKDGTDIAGATTLSYKLDTVTTASAGNYTLSVSYAGGTCVSNAGALTTSVVLYSNATGNINDISTWGVQTNGSGSTPVDFTRAEHIFIIANRDTATTTANIKIAGTYDVGNGKTTITAGTTFEAGRIIKSLTQGSFAGTATSALIVHGKSDLYFDTDNKVMQTLTINTTDTVKLHTALNMTAGSGHGIVILQAGVFSTGDSLTLKSDASGTAGVGNSAGTVIGKVTVERFIPPHRSWRLFCSPVAAAGAPTINAAWQEGAISSTDNPHPGYGTHITYGTVANGFDQNPQKSFSMKIFSSGAWVGVPATNTTLITDYPAYFIFIRGNRSYNILSTTNTTTPMTTTLRATGNLNQGTQSNIAVDSGAFALINNPYASPIDFESVYSHSQNIAHRIRVWDPNLGGTYGTGAYVTVYWNGNGYSTVPSITGGANLRFVQASEGFFTEGIDVNAYVAFREADKDTANTIMPFGRLTEADAQSKLEVNLKIVNDDSTTGISDGVAYLFGKAFNNDTDKDDIEKISNLSENLSILSNSKLLAVEQRKAANNTDSLHLNLTGVKSTNYQLEFIAVNISSRLYLFDKYLNTTTPINTADTTRIAININTSVAASKAADRFVIITKTLTVLPPIFTNINATIKEQTAQVNWSVANEVNTQYYEVERSANSSSFSKIGDINATGNKSYSFTDGKPLKGVNYYRVKSISATGTASYTSVVNVVFNSDDKNFIAVYPNPLTSNHCMIDLHSKPSGKYSLQLINSAGQFVFTTTVTTTENNSVQPVLLPLALAKGIYQLQAEGAGKKDIIKLIIGY